MGKNLDQEVQEKLRRLHLDKEAERRVADFLAKESEKWNSGQQRRRELYSADRERGVGARTKTALRSASLGRGKIRPESFSFAPVPEDDVVYCTNSASSSATGGSFTSSSAVALAACAELNEISKGGAEDIKWDGASWGDSLAEFVMEPSVAKPPKKKGSLDHLLIDMDVPSLESLLIDVDVPNLKSLLV